MTSDSHDRFRSALADRYRIERKLGAGGMATVYLAEDVRHHRKVALKLLHPELSAVLGPERFLKEIELTASLQHPHILALFDSGSVDGQLFYVMPYVPGETLRGRLERERQLPIAEAVRLATEVADALSYAHGLVYLRGNENRRLVWVDRSGKSSPAVDTPREFFLISAALSFGPAPAVGPRTPLFSGRYEDDYDVSKDGTRFLMIESETSGLSLVVVPNWLTELRQLTAARKP